MFRRLYYKNTVLRSQQPLIIEQVLASQGALNEVMPLVHHSIELLYQMKQFDKGSEYQTNSDQSIVLDADVTVISIPYSAMLIACLHNLYSASSLNFVVLIPKAAALPFKAQLQQLERVHVIDHQALLAKFNQAEQHKLVIFSCLELHPKTLATGKVTQIADKDYCISLFDVMFYLKNSPNLTYWDFDSAEIKNLLKYEAGEILPQLGGYYEHAIMKNSAAIFAWTYLQNCELVREHRKQYLRLSQLEAQIRTARELNNDTIFALECLTKLKVAKDTIRVTL